PRRAVRGAGSRGSGATSASDKPLTLSGFDVIRPRLYTADGKELEVHLGRNATPKRPPPVELAPGGSWTWRPQATLSFQREGGSWRLSGPDGRGVPGTWSVLALPEGQHRLVVEYADRQPKRGDGRVSA